MVHIDNFYSAMSNIVFPKAMNSPAGNSIIVSPRGEILAHEKSPFEEGIINAQIPIKPFREGRRITNYAYEMVKPVFNQYREEFPINHMDMPRQNLPQTGKAMKDLLDSKSLWAKGKSWKLDPATAEIEALE